MNRISHQTQAIGFDATDSLDSQHGGVKTKGNS